MLQNLNVVVRCLQQPLEHSFHLAPCVRLAHADTSLYFPPTRRAHSKASKRTNRFAAMHPYIERTGSFIEGDHSLTRARILTRFAKRNLSYRILPPGLVTIRYREQSSLEALSQNISFARPFFHLFRSLPVGPKPLLHPFTYQLEHLSTQGHRQEHLITGHWPPFVSSKTRELASCFRVSRTH